MCMFYRYTASDGQVPNSCCPCSLPNPPPSLSLPKDETQPPRLQTRPGPSHATASCRKNRHGVRQSSLCPGNSVQATASDQGAEEVPFPLLFGFSQSGVFWGGGEGGLGLVRESLTPPRSALTSSKPAARIVRDRWAFGPGCGRHTRTRRRARSQSFTRRRGAGSPTP